VTARTAELIRFLGLSGIEQVEAGSLSYGGQRLLDMGLALAARRVRCCSTSRWPASPPRSASASAA
jgi:hypothetical protein